MTRIIPFFLLIMMLTIAPSQVQAVVSPETADSIAHRLNETDVCNSSCSYYASEHPLSGIVNTIVILLLIIFGSIWHYKTYKKKYILFIAILMGLAVVTSYVYPTCFKTKNRPLNCPIIEPAKEFTAVEDSVTL